MSPLAQAIGSARALALQPEQSLLRMLSQERASRRGLVEAVKCYRRAARVLEGVCGPVPEEEADTDAVTGELS